MNPKTPMNEAALFEDKEELLTLLLEEEGFDIPQMQVITPRKNTENPPLSFAQQRLWFMDQLEPGNPFYNTPAAVRLVGPLNVTALEQSFNEIVRRHEALRTTFAPVNGHPVQVIAPELTLKLRLVDLTPSPEAEREAEAWRLANEEVRQPFDLTTGPLLRTVLLRLQEEEHVVLLTMHHIISDAWSMGLIIQEMAILYTAFAAGKPSPLPELSIQYPDFAVWQRGLLQGEMMETLLAYWKEQLAGAPPMVTLLADRPRPAVQTYRGASQPFLIPKPLTEALKALSQREGGTLFMTLLAVFKTLLYRYTAQADMVVGTRLADRDRLNIEGLIGFFVNALVLRTNLSGNPTFLELMARVREMTLAAYTHQDLPFEKLVEELQPERDLSRQPLFNVMFVLQTTSIPRMELPGLSVYSYELDSGTSKYDLDLSMRERDDGLRAVLEYNTDLFDADTINQMVNHFLTLLEAVVADPTQRLSELPLLSDAEQHLLAEWNDTQPSYLDGHSLAQLFELQVERTPETIAVISGKRRLSYRELNGQANQLAHYLQTLGVGSEILVGVYIEDAVETATALLAVLKAGGACVLLNPVFEPGVGLASPLAHVPVSILLTDQQLPAQLFEPQAKVICLGAAQETLARQSKSNPTSKVTAANLACVLYAAGSTDRPAAVAVTQQQFLNHLAWVWQTYPFEEGETACQTAPVSFWPSLGGLLEALLQGVPTVILPGATLQDPPQLIQMLAEQAVTRITLTPAILRMILDAQPDRRHHLSQLKLWHTGGDRLSGSLAQRFHEYLPQARLLNSYGSVEINNITYYEAGQQAGSRVTIPLGRPIAGMQIHLLDPNLQAVPPGASGELYIGGILPRSYYDQPELTAERFIPDPFNAEPGQRLYKTGDLACYRSNGVLEFIRRLDQEVRVRGFYIERGQVEAALDQHPAVRQGVIMIRQAALEPDNKYVVAYIVPQQGHDLTGDHLRAFLKEKLPQYMIPSLFILLEAIPLTSEGKIDYWRLPEPDPVESGPKRPFVLPRTPTEKELAGIWMEVLGLEQVSIHDNFFELGGHSLLATQVISRVLEFYQFKFSQGAFELEGVLLNKLFEEPTLAALAESIETIRWAGQGWQDSLKTVETDFEEIEL